jgi:regulator of microtubule dynamics protein 3
MKTTLLIILGLFFTALQTNEELYKTGLEYRKAQKIKEGFEVFSKLMKADSSNSYYIGYGSYFYSKYGYTFAKEDDKPKHYKIAEYLAKKAIKLDETNAEAHYAYALALGRLSENASSSTKVSNSKLIKKEADRTLALNPKHAGAYHILGRWNRTIAGFSGIEKAMINTFYGGVPPNATYADAVKCFENAVINEPKFLLHQYELAVTYHEMDKDAFAKPILAKVLSSPVTFDDDVKVLKEAADLLKKIK